jgi:hypothetical protein
MEVPMVTALPLPSITACLPCRACGSPCTLDQIYCPACLYRIQAMENQRDGFNSTDRAIPKSVVAGSRELTSRSHVDPADLPDGAFDTIDEMIERYEAKASA